MSRSGAITHTNRLPLADARQYFPALVLACAVGKRSLKASDARHSRFCT